MTSAKSASRRASARRRAAPVDAATLVETVLEEEAKRRNEQAERGREEAKAGEGRLPGVGGEALTLAEIVRRGGVATIAVLFGLNFVDEFDRLAFAVLGPDIQRSLDVSDSVLAIAGALGGLLVFAAAIPIGYLADRTRRTAILGIFSAFWAVFSILTGLARSSWQLLGARVLTGIGKANEAPVQKPILADAYPMDGRSRIYAIHNAANPVGNLVGPALAGGIAVAVGGTAGWRWAFVILSLPAAALAVAAFFLPEPRRGRNEQEAVFGGDLGREESEVPISVGAAFARLRRIKTYNYLLASVAAIGFGFVSAPIFVNLVLEEQFGLDAAGRGLVGTIVAAGAVAGAVVGGRYGDELFRRSPERLMQIVGVAVASFGVTMPVSVYMPNVWGYMAIASASAAFTTGAFVPASAIIAAVTPFRLRSMGFAIIGVYLSLVGGVGGAVIAGGISDGLGPQAAIAITVPIAALVGGVLMAYGSRFIRRDIALTVADLREEEGERARLRTGGKVPALQVRNLDFSYGHIQVLFDIDLDVWPGEVVALLGTNGAGKSTLLRAISGLGIPDRGTVRLGARTITYADPGARVKLGLVQVPGGKAVFPSLTVAENLVAGAYTYVWETERVRSRIDRVTELFPVLRDRLDQPAGTLSGGEQQMLAIGKALLLDPRVLLIDELSLGLAPVLVQELFGVVEQLKATGVTMVIVEQSVNIALSLADRAIFMEKGRIRFEGPASDLLERDDLVRAVFLGGTGGVV